MAGSINHIIDDDKSFNFEFIENLGDAYELAEETYWLANYVSNGDYAKLQKILDKMSQEMRGERKPIRKFNHRTTATICKPSKDGH